MTLVSLGRERYLARFAGEILRSLARVKRCGLILKSCFAFGLHLILGFEYPSILFQISHVSFVGKQ